MFSIVENAKFRLKPYRFSNSLLAITIEEDKKNHVLTIRSYIFSSMEEEERDELSCYTTEVISDYPVPPYSLREPIIEVLSFSREDIQGSLVYTNPQML